MAKAKKNKEMEILLSVFTNDVTDESAYQVLQLFYKGAVENSIGIMRALNNSTGDTELILVGVEKDGSGVKTYPLAKVLTPDDVPNYFSPNGVGGWFDPLDSGTKEPEAMDFSLPEPVDVLDEPSIN